MANAAIADTELKAEHFVLKLPSTWEIETLSDRAYLRGPSNEQLVVTSIRITGYRIASGGSESDWKIMRKEFGEHLTKEMLKASQNNNLRVTKELTEFSSDSGYPAWELNTETTSGETYFNLYGAVGSKVVLYLTVKGKGNDERASTELLEAIKTIEWK